MDFVKNYDEIYFELLRLATVSDNREYTESMLEYAVKVLNEYPLYFNSQKRIVALLLSKANRLNIIKNLKPAVQEFLRAKTREAIITELGKKRQLNIIIEQFSFYDIPIILLKGTAFPGSLYSDKFPRSSSDIDVLVKEKDWAKAKECLNNFMKPEKKMIDGIFGDLYEVTFKPLKNTGAAVDLHNALINPILFRVKESSLWECSVVHPQFNNENVRVLSPEHALIHQALHAYKDMNFSKYNLVDTHEIMSTQTPDLEKTISIAKEWNASTPLFILLKNCAELISIRKYNDLLVAIKPIYITYNLSNYLLKSRFTQPFENRKPFRYRINQMIGQFVFTGSIVRPLKVQYVFIKSYILQN